MSIIIKRYNKETKKYDEKEYHTVAERLLTFHKENKNASVITKLLSQEDGVILFRAKITPEVDKPHRYFTGHASEKIGANFINQTSALENAETSAIGRALASAGYIGTEFASADEVANTMVDQGAKAKVKDKVEIPEIPTEQASGEHKDNKPTSTVPKSKEEEIRAKFEDMRKKIGDEDFKYILKSEGYDSYGRIKTVNEAERILNKMASVAMGGEKSSSE